MRRLNLVIKLIGLSALLLGSVLGSFVLMSIVSLWLLMGLASPGGTNISFFAISLLIFLGCLGLILLYWHFIVLKVFKNVRKSIIQKAK
tara:strand:+ start:206 stop:472 length:267 start_codon:yes stop_codon:yes gene_type:complete